MLRTRILTALVILPLFAVALFWFPNWAWDAFTAFIVLVACREWSQFCRFEGRHGTVFRVITVMLVLLLGGLYLMPSPALFKSVAQALFGISAIFWFVVVPLWLGKGWQLPHPWAVGIAGWVVIFPTWAAFLMLHDIGAWLLLSIMVIVFAADVGAYFAGRRFGKTKLAPRVSPNKTWEGVVGGLVLVMVYFFIWFLIVRKLDQPPWAIPLLSFGAWLPMVFLALAGVSVLGDLYESWLKRCVGVKDSGTLLPGHGGVLDRIDALTAALPLAGLLLQVLPRP